MSKMAKQPADASWQGQWAQAVTRSLQQLQAHTHAGVPTSGDEHGNFLAQLDEALIGQILEGLNQPLDTFHDGLNQLCEELSRHGLEHAYDRFVSYLNEAAQTQQWEHEAPTPQGLRHVGGRSSLFGLGLLMLTTSAAVGQQWSPQANEAMARLLVEHRQVSASGRLVLLPVGLNTQETVDLEPWMGYRLTALLCDWAQSNPTGHPSVDEALAMARAAGLDLALQRGPSAGIASGARSKYLRHLTLLGLHIPSAEDVLGSDDDEVQDCLDYDFPQANFAAGVVTGERDLEQVLLALALRQGSSSLGASDEQAQAATERFAHWSLSALEEEATGLSAQLDGLRSQHPDLAIAHGLQGFCEGAFAQALSAVLTAQLVAAGDLVDVQPAWPATFVFEATDEGLKAYRDLSFRASVSLAVTKAGLEQAWGLGVTLDHDAERREFQALLQLSTGTSFVGFAAWSVFPWESLEDALLELRQTLVSLGISVKNASTSAAPVLH